MTFADPKLAAAVSRPSKTWGPIYDESIAVVDSPFVFDQFKLSVEHYLAPVSRQWANPALRFNTLKTEWESETAHLSSITEISIHPAYQQIIGMGTIALPYIMDALRKKPGHWFWALKAITGEDPVSPSERGKIKQMAEAWLKWGKEQGYIR